MRAQPSLTPMRRGRLPARSCRHARVDGPDRPSGRNAYPSGITPSTIMSPAPGPPGPWTEIRLGARAHRTRTTNRAHEPPPTNLSTAPTRGRLGACRRVPAQIRSVATAPSESCPPEIRFIGGLPTKGRCR
jgi:hypothetical protein